MSLGLKHLKFAFVLLLVLPAIFAACTAQASTPTSAPGWSATISAYPELPMITGTPKAVVAKSGPVSITEFDGTLLPNNQLAINVCTQGANGVGLTIRVSYTYWSTPVGPQPSTVIKELGVPCFSEVDRPVLNISDIKGNLDPTILIQVDVKTADDPNWDHPVTQTKTYNVETKNGAK